MPREEPTTCKKCLKPRGKTVVFRTYPNGTFGLTCNRCNHKNQKKPENPVKPDTCLKCGQSEPDVVFTLSCLGYYKNSCNQCLKYYQYMYGAKNRGIFWDEVNMTRAYCVSLMLMPCFYCNERDVLNGIDRFDSQKSYTQENCVACCTKCNLMKGSMDGISFLCHCAKVAQHERGVIPDATQQLQKIKKRPPYIM